ncbi:Anaphase-promoting complex subunit 10 [Diplonema papillatum]|nr:Anaphase-promoting complex subunit 10 [Diplonema papillatum]KAJ9468926.1 Anaphase-promoting complex subunit 10 [Diplonema papillatum]
MHPVGLVREGSSGGWQVGEHTRSGDREAPSGGVEIGKYATWSVSSAKHGNGVEQLRDGLESTFWQSDGLQPHLIDVQWSSTVRISEVGVYLEYSADETYTPKKLVIRAGNSYHDLQEVWKYELHEPEGWTWMSVGPVGQCVHASLVQIAIQENHQNGRDSHLRQVKVIGPALVSESFSTNDFWQHASLR